MVREKERRREDLEADGGGGGGARGGSPARLERLRRVPRAHLGGQVEGARARALAAFESDASESPSRASWNRGLHTDFSAYSTSGRMRQVSTTYACFPALTPVSALSATSSRTAPV